MKSPLAAVPLVLFLVFHGRPAEAAKLKTKAAAQARQSAASAPGGDFPGFSMVADGSRALPAGAPGGPVVTAFSQGGPVMRPADDRPLAPSRRSTDLKIAVRSPELFPFKLPPRGSTALKQYALGAVAGGLLLVLADLVLLGKARQGDKAVREAERRHLEAQRARAQRAEAELERQERHARGLEERLAACERDLKESRAKLEAQKGELEFARRRFAVLEEEAAALAKQRARPEHDDIERAMDAGHGSVVWTNALGVLLDRIDDSVRAIDSHLGPGRGPDHVARSLASIDHDLKKAGDLVENVQTFMRAKSGDVLNNVQYFLRKSGPPLV